MYLSKVDYYYLATRISNDTARKSALINYNFYFVLFSRVDGFSLTDPCLKKTWEGLLQIRQTLLSSESADSKMDKMFLTLFIVVTWQQNTLVPSSTVTERNVSTAVEILGYWVFMLA